MQHEVIGFALPFDREMVYCEAVMMDYGFKVLFNGAEITNLTTNDNGQFEQTTSVLSLDLVLLIGNRVEDHYF